jgi:hypothetical protein
MPSKLKIKMNLITQQVIIRNDALTNIIEIYQITKIFFTHPGTIKFT